MPSIRECHEVLLVHQKIQETEKDIPCITLHDVFVPVCLNVRVLQTAYFQYRQQYGNTPSQTN